MTRLSWRKRPSKKMVATLLFIVILTVGFFYRQPIAIKSIQHFTKPHGLYITCLDFSLNWRLDLILKQACITSVMGTIVVNDAIWQPWSNTVSVEQVKVKHLKQLSTNNSNNKVNKVDNGSSTEQQKNKRKQQT